MTDSSDAQERADPRIFCFEHVGEEETFELSLMKLVSKMQEQSRETFVSEHNVLRMNHGGSWVHAARQPEPDTTLHTLSAEWVIPFKDVAENDLGLIARTILPMNEELEKQFAQNMYGVVGAAAESVGNVVDAQAAGSFSQSMIEMFSKIELGVDRDGNVIYSAGPDLPFMLGLQLGSTSNRLRQDLLICTHGFSKRTRFHLLP